MPSLITHELFGKEVCRSLPMQLEKMIKQNPKEFSIGTSGPDLFFYYNAWPWMNQKDASRVASMGGKIHKIHIHDFFRIVFEDTKLHQTQKKISYVAGLLCHWALDKEAHPYIFNQTSSDNKEKSSLYHRYFESHLDFLLLQLIRSQSPMQYPCYKLVKYDNETITAITDVYKRPLSEIYNESLNQDIVKTSLKHFYGIQRFLFDPKNMKKNILFKLEKSVLKKPYAFTSMIVPIEEDTLDILNNQHRVWHHPCTNKTSTSSFVEIFNNSIPIGQDICTLFFNYLKNEVELDEVLSFINNQSFETGLSVDSTMKYFDCIYQK